MGKGSLKGLRMCNDDEICICMLSDLLSPPFRLIIPTTARIDTCYVAPRSPGHSKPLFSVCGLTILYDSLTSNGVYCA